MKRLLEVGMVDSVWQSQHIQVEGAPRVKNNDYSPSASLNLEDHPNVTTRNHSSIMNSYRKPFKNPLMDSLIGKSFSTIDGNKFASNTFDK